MPQSNRSQGVSAGLPGSNSPRRDSPFRSTSSPRQGLVGLSPSSPRRVDPPARPAQPAVSVKLSVTSRASGLRSPRSAGKSPESNVEIQADIAPLHAFCDLALVFSNAEADRASETLEFLRELSAGDVDPSGPVDKSSYDDDDPFGSEDDDDTPPATPRAASPYARRDYHEREQERERKRLERLVLEDLDLEYDYRQSETEPIARQSTSRVKSWRKVRKPCLHSPVYI